MGFTTGVRRFVAIGVLVLLVCVVVVYFLYQSAPAQDVISPAVESSPDVTTEVSDAVQSPAEQLPETNPFSGYTNPFE